MRCFTYVHRAVSEGIQISNDEKHGKIVFLGEMGSGKTFRKISLDRKNPAIIEDGMIHKAVPKEITVFEKGKPGVVKVSFFVLSKAFNDNNKILLRINTTEAELKTRRSGTWCAVAPGEKEEETGVKVFYNAHGGTFRFIEKQKAYRLENRYCDDLVSLAQNRAVLIDPLGANHEDAMVVWNKCGHAVCLTHEEWDILQSDDEIDAEKAAESQAESQAESSETPAAESSTEATATPEAVIEPTPA